MELEILILSEVSQQEKDKYHVQKLLKIKKRKIQWDKMENKLMSQKRVKN